MALFDITMSDVIKTFKTIGLTGNVPPGYTFTFYDKIEESVDDEMFGLNGRINSMIAKPTLLESVLQLDYHSFKMNETRHVNLAFERLGDIVIERFIKACRDNEEKNKIIDISDNDEVAKIQEQYRFFELGLVVTDDPTIEAKIAKYHEDSTSYIISINHRLSKRLDELKSSVMHEMTHLVDMLGSRAYLGLYVSSKYKIDDMEANFLYTFSPKEINARTTELYYTLKEKKYTKEQYREVIDSLEKKIWNFDHRRELASSGYVYDPSRELSAEKDWSLSKNYWSLITLFDRMIYHIYRIENMSPTSQMLFVKKLISLMSDNKNIRRLFRDSGADIADRELINDCFGIREDMPTSRAIKRILEKANIILKKFVSRLRVVLSDLEAGSDGSLVL